MEPSANLIIIYIKTKASVQLNYVETKDFFQNWNFYICHYYLFLHKRPGFEIINVNVIEEKISLINTSAIIIECLLFCTE